MEHEAGRIHRLAPGRVVLLVLALCSGCSGPPDPGFLKSGKLGLVVVGQSSRTDVFTALGRPVRTERSGAGESWVYEAGADKTATSGLVSGATMASTVVGAFVPLAGLVGPGIGLANSARTPADTANLVVKFGADGIVVDCTQSSTAMPQGLPGSDPSLPADCTRPSPEK